MTNFTAAITNAQKYQLVAAPKDDANDPQPISGPIKWDNLTPELAGITPSADAFALQCVVSPVKGRSGVARIVASDPADPSIPPVEADITISPLATRLILGGSVMS